MMLFHKASVILVALYVASSSAQIPHFRFPTEVDVVSDTGAAKVTSQHLYSHQPDKGKIKKEGKPSDRKSESELHQEQVIMSCPHNPDANGDRRDACVADVIIVGSGVSGLAAAAFLKRKGKKVLVLEARAAGPYGRVEKTDYFNLPSGVGIDMGAEWIHTNLNNGKYKSNLPGVLIKDLLQDINDNPSGYNNEQFFFHDWSGDYLWKDSTWYDFIKKEVVEANGLEPFIWNGITVGKIDKQKDWWNYTWVTQAGEDPWIFKAPHVIVTVPIDELQKKKIQFIPEMPANYWNALEAYEMGTALKGFVEVEEAFDKKDLPGYYGRSFFFDEMRTKTDRDTRHIVGYFADYEGQATAPYENLSDNQLKEKLLDTIKEKLTPVQPVKAIARNWNKVGFIETGYAYDLTDCAIKTLQGAFLFNGVYFAGEGIPVDGEDNSGLVHGSVFSGKAAAMKVLDQPEAESLPTCNGHTISTQILFTFSLSILFTWGIYLD